MIVPQVQITLGCNLACNYCFQNHDDSRIMDSTTLENIINKSVAYNKKTTPSEKKLEILWHGGEPLLGGVDFFRKIIEYESKHGDVEFINKVQTNGIAMNDKMAEFLVSNKFNVGFSLDGPRETHDHHRLIRNGKSGSFNATIKGIECYRKHSKAPFIPVIAVITKHTIEKGAEEFYKFFRELNSCLQLDPYDITCYDLANSRMNVNESLFIPSPVDYAKFVIDLFNLWFYDDPGKIDLRDMKNEIKFILCPEVRMDSVIDKKRCSVFRTIIDPSGRVYSCDQYINDENTSLGNINEQSLEEIMNKKFALWEKIKTIFRKDTGNYLCNSCEYGNMCGGGCLTCMKYNSLILKRLSINKMPEETEYDLLNQFFPDSGDSIYCQAYKIYRPHIEKCVKEEMALENKPS